MLKLNGVDTELIMKPLKFISEDETNNVTNNDSKSNNNVESNNYDSNDIEEKQDGNNEKE